MIKKPLVHLTTQQIDRQFYKRKVHHFRRFLAYNQGVTNWLIVSDYNIGDPSRPNDVIAFSILPNDVDGGHSVAAIKECFPADFKNLQRIPAKAIGYFRRRSAAFHISFVLEKNSTMLLRPGETKLEAARRSVVETLAYLEENGAPEWITKSVNGLKQQSKANKFSHKIYDKMMFLTCCYSFVVGLLHRERPTTKSIVWCSDRDPLVTWAGSIIDTFALTSAVRWATHMGKSLTSEDLPRLILKPAGVDPLDFLIRPPDYLAAALSSWKFPNIGSTQPSLKYRDVLRDIIADNRNVSVLQISVREFLSVTELQMHRL